MLIDTETRPLAPTEATAVCRTDGMPLYPTIVGPRCPLCGAAAEH